MSEANRDFAVQQLRDCLASIRDLLDASDVQEIMVNGVNDVWVERAGVGLSHCPEIEISRIQIESAIHILAGLSDRDVQAGTDSGLVDARMEGFRVAAVAAPTSVRGPTISIRKHSPVVLTLDDYERSGAIPPGWADKFRQMVADKRNILVAGGTSSGKTTFLNALIREINSNERIVTIEEIPELKVLVPCWVSFEYNNQKGITARMLVKMALRYRPDRIIIGEVRDAAGYDLLDAASTGHEGSLATFHAKSAEDALSRFETFVLQANLGWPYEAIRRQIARTFDFVVYMGRPKGVRCLCEVLQLHDYDTTNGRYEFDLLYKLKDY